MSEGIWTDPAIKGRGCFYMKTEVIVFVILVCGTGQILASSQFPTSFSMYGPGFAGNAMQK